MDSDDDRRCPHFNGAVKIDKVMKKVFKARSQDKTWTCAECDVRSDSGSVWACLKCAHVGCGRYHAQHAAAHYASHQKHPVTIELSSGACHCYECDDYVINDTRHGDIRMFRHMLFELSTDDNRDEAQSRSGRIMHAAARVAAAAAGRKSEMDMNGQGESDGSEGNADGEESAAYEEEEEEIDVVDIDDDRICGKKRPHSELADGTSASVTAEGETNANGTSEQAGIVLGLAANPMAGCSNDVAVPVQKKRKRGRPRKIVNAVPGQVGLRNLGNTCFMNSVVQALSNTDHFRSHVLQLCESDFITGSATLFDAGAEFNRATRRKNLTPDHISIGLELKKAFTSLWSRKGIAYSPDSFLSVVWRVLPRFYGYHQQDAHEFLRHVLDRLSGEVESTQLPNFVDLFRGMLQSEVTCMTCHTTSQKQDPFLDLSLVIPEVEEEESVSLADCLHRFVEPEKLEEREKYSCTQCALSKETAMKKFTLHSLPEVLCLHLKRFKWLPPERTKVGTHVDFPAQLDVSSYCNEKVGLGTTYYLYAVVSHHGDGSGAGHYTSHCFNQDAWHHFNDSVVRKCPLSEVLRQQAYLLFYVRATAVQPLP